MRQTLVSLASLLISCFILMAGNGLINILLPVRMNLESIDTETIGFILSLYFVGMLIGGFYAKHLINRAGHIRMFAGCVALAAMSILICSLYTDALLWGAMRVIIGFCNACVFAAMESWLSGSSTEDNRGKILAIYQAVVLGAIFCGQFLINLVSPEADSLFILSGILLCMAIIPIVMSQSAGPEVTEVTPMSLLSLLRISPLGVITCFIAGITYAAVFNMLPIYADGFGITGFDLSLYMGAAVTGAFLLQFPVGYLSDRYDRRTVLLTILLLSAFAGFSINLFAAQALFLLMSIATGVSCGIIACLYPLSISESFDRLRKSELISAMGSLIIAFALGGIIGPYATSMVMSKMGSSSLFYFVGGIQLLLGLFVVYRMTIRASLPDDQQEEFVMQGGAAIAMVDLDPRTEYVEPEQPLSSEAETAVMVAESDPAAAVKMTKAVFEATPEQGVEMAGAVASVEGIDALRLYEAILEAAPEKLTAITLAIIEAQPELAYELISHLAKYRPDRVVEIASRIGVEVPGVSLDMARLAVEQEPESAVEVVELLAQVVADNYENVRHADREDDTSEQDAADIVTNIAEWVPEQTLDLATAVVETMPDSAAKVAEEVANGMTSDTDDKGQAEAISVQAEEESHEEMVELVQRLTEVAPEHAADVAVAVVEAVPESAALVATEYATTLSDNQSDQVLEELVATIDSFDSTADVLESQNQEAADFVSRVSELVPESTVDVAVAVIEAMPESASDVVDALRDAEGEHLFESLEEHEKALDAQDTV